MQYRPLGRLGLSVSELTLGTRGLDARVWKDLDLVEAGATMALAFESGVNAIDISPAYGDAEAVVGEILRREGAGRPLHILSHVPPLTVLDLPSPYVPVEDAYPGWHIRASTEASLKALGVERLCVQQIDTWTPEWFRQGDWLETLHRLRDEGKIAGVGVSLFDHDPDAALEIVASGAVDCVQVMYNIFDQGPAGQLFPLCRKTGTGVIARSPLYAGALTEMIDREAPFAPGDWRNTYFFDAHLKETRGRVSKLAAYVEPDQSLSDMALRFCLSSPAVSSVSTGMRTRSHVEANLRAIDRSGLPVDTVRLLAQHKWLC